MRLGGIVDKPGAWKQRGRPQLLTVEDPQVRAQHVKTKFRLFACLICHKSVHKSHTRLCSAQLLTERLRLQQDFMPVICDASCAAGPMSSDAMRVCLLSRHHALLADTQEPGRDIGSGSFNIAAIAEAFAEAADMLAWALRQTAPATAARAEAAAWATVQARAHSQLSCELAQQHNAL